MSRPPLAAGARWLLGLVAAASCVAMACGSAADRRKLLTFFFDGVEDDDPRAVTVLPADAALADQVKGSASGSSQASGSQHAPFANQECYLCHPGSRTGGLAVRGPDICFDCHVLADYTGPFTHAPLLSDGCVLCHSPHESPERHLVRRPERKLCGTCHDVTDVQYTSRHAQIPAGTRCTHCHDPHGAPTRQLLLPLDASRCGSCHPRQVDPATASHAPINAGTCAPCHRTDHQGSPPYLTDLPGALCLQCHDAAGLNGAAYHVPENGAGCTSCHDPHKPSPANRRELGSEPSAVPPPPPQGPVSAPRPGDGTP